MLMLIYYYKGTPESNGAITAVKKILYDDNLRPSCTFHNAILNIMKKAKQMKRNEWKNEKEKEQPRLIVKKSEN